MVMKASLRSLESPASLGDGPSAAQLVMAAVRKALGL